MRKLRPSGALREISHLATAPTKPQEVAEKFGKFRKFLRFGVDRWQMMDYNNGMNIRRVYEKIIAAHLAKYRQMVFLSGPRQVGKTTLAKSFSSSYLDWDNVDARALILKGPGAVATTFAPRQLGARLPVVSGLSSGTRIIILTVLIAAGAALLRPVKTPERDPNFEGGGGQ